jgi:alkylation response protein AidB-like acyl-CoA dehydrogenase
MLNLDVTDEQRLLEQALREWAGREIAPRIRELDRAHPFDRDLFPRMAALELLGISVPVEYGGAGMDYLCSDARAIQSVAVRKGNRYLLTGEQIMQADDLLGYRTDRPARCELPAVERGQ